MESECRVVRMLQNCSNCGQSFMATIFLRRKLPNHRFAAVSKVYLGSRWYALGAPYCASGQSEGLFWFKESTGCSPSTSCVVKFHKCLHWVKLGLGECIEWVAASVCQTWVVTGGDLRRCTNKVRLSSNPSHHSDLIVRHRVGSGGHTCRSRDWTFWTSCILRKLQEGYRDH